MAAAGGDSSASFLGDNCASPAPRSTGTTLAGVVFNGGVVLGADSRATNEHLVADKNCTKIHRLSSRLFCCAAGTSADCERVVQAVRLELMDQSRRMQLRQGKCGIDDIQKTYTRVIAAEKLFQRILYSSEDLSCAVLIGGCDARGSHLCEVNTGGSVSRSRYAAVGSGTFAATSALEAGYQEGMTEDSAKQLVCSAIQAGISGDLYSGSKINTVTIREDGVKLEGFLTQAPRSPSQERARLGSHSGTSVQAPQVISSHTFPSEEEAQPKMLWGDMDNGIQIQRPSSGSLMGECDFID